MSSFTDRFAGVAGAYASRRPRYPEELFDYLKSLCPGHGLAWDCAAGTGQATIPLAARFRMVIATDASESMLAQAPWHPRVEYRVAAAGSSGIASASVDLVSVAQALHWLDLEDFYREADRVLVEGGMLAAWTYGVQLVEGADVNRLLQDFYTDVLGPYWPPERRHVESGYSTLPFPYPELTPPLFSMKERWTMEELLGYVGTWSATQTFRHATSRNPVEELSRRLAAMWGNPAQRRAIEWPLTLRLGRKAA